MEVGGFEINFPEQIHNVVLNEFFSNMAENDIDGIKIKKTLTIFNQNNISSEKAFKILQELSAAMAEIENLYGGGMEE